MESLNAQGNPWPTLIFALGVALVWAVFAIRGRLRHGKARVQREHERLTDWFPALRDSEATAPLVLPSLQEGGRHRADRLTSR